LRVFLSLFLQPAEEMMYCLLMMLASARPV
jgi:hypothetical protein